MGHISYGQIDLWGNGCPYTRTFNTSRFVCLPGTIYFLSLGQNMCLSRRQLFYPYKVLYSQGTLLYGQIFAGNMCARKPHTFTGMFSVFRAKYVPATQADCLSVYVLYRQGTLLHGQIFSRQMFARISYTFTSWFSGSRAQSLPVRHSRICWSI